MKSWKLEAVILAIGMLVMGYFIKQGLDCLLYTSRILQVQWIALSVLCSLLLSFWVSFVKFYNSVNSSVQYLTECRLVHNLVFSPLSVLAYNCLLYTSKTT